VTLTLDGRAHTVSPTGVVIGRSRECDLRVSDGNASRRHAEVTQDGEAWLVTDLGSTNGTFVNRGRRLLPGAPQVLTDGDEIIVGKTFLRFKIKQD